MEGDIDETKYEHLEQQDKITLKSTAKGMLQAEVRIGGKMENNEDVDKIINLQTYAWSSLKQKFSNLLWQENTSQGQNLDTGE
jgi:hypothetical protein